MDISTWKTALEVYTKFKQKHGREIGRKKLQNILDVPEHEARSILWAIKHKHIISMQAVEYDTPKKDLELIIADIHIPYEDKIALQTLFNWLDTNDIKPTIITILGDLLDFYKISRFSKDPTRKNVAVEIELGKQFLIDLRNRFPDVRIILYNGNHENRLQKYIWDNAPQLTELVRNLLPEKLGLKELNIEFHETPFRIGKLWHLHGHERGRGGYNAEYITNVMWKYIHDNFIVAHWHRRQEKIFKSISGKTYYGGVVGCLCQDMDYAILNNWTKGFALVYYDINGFFNVKLYDIIDGYVL